ncbi:MAG: DUF2244 domain-containing protein [Rhizobiales bacterium]|nr:DUF2244 domain-containing protein [Hyphomicrobiales bacterium]
MTADNGAEREEPIFSAVITPHRSLSTRGFVALMLIFGAMNFAAGVMFYRAGAWPIGGFLGLDVALLFFAFRANYRSAAAYEQVVVTSTALTVRKVAPGGRAEEFTFNPRWVKLDRWAIEDFGLRRIALVSHGQSLPIADSLSPSERENFARALAGALAEVRHGVLRPTG